MKVQNAPLFKKRILRKIVKGELDRGVRVPPIRSRPLCGAEPARVYLRARRRIRYQQILPDVHDLQNDRIGNRFRPSSPRATTRMRLRRVQRLLPYGEQLIAVEAAFIKLLNVLWQTVPWPCCVLCRQLLLARPRQSLSRGRSERQHCLG